MRGALLGFLLFLPFSGCLSGDGGDGPRDQVDGDGMGGNSTLYPLPGTVTGMEFITNGNSNGTTGIWIDGDTAYLSGGVGLRILDITDPARPALLAADIPDTNSRDVDILHHPNNRTYAVLADSGENGMKLVDVTDPVRAELVATEPHCVHTVAVVPNSTVVYASWSLCHAIPPGEQMQAGDVTIVDWADPLNPTWKIFAFPPVVITEGGVPRPVTATSCHEMTFNAELQRAYCAGISNTMIWDISDPLNPEIVQVIDWPLINIHHSVYDARDGDLLIIADEFGGVATPSPPCTDPGVDPTSALWFFDISDLATPVPVGYFQIDHNQLSGDTASRGYCSTHLGEIVDGRDLMVLGWYTAGTVLIDFSDPANAFQVAHYRAADPTSVWEARYHNGHVFSADTQRGLDISRLTGGTA
jgi:hypothetical protein